LSTIQKPVSLPLIPSQPGSEYYGVDSIALFKNYTRDAYRAAFGIEAPAFDPSRPPKSWFDSSADTSYPENMSIYKVLARDGKGNWAIRQMIIPSGEAATVNLKGSIRYEPYVVAPTYATRGDAPINPNYLSSEAGARALMAEVGGTGLVEEQLAMFPVHYPDDERRRIWNIVFRGFGVNAGILILNKNANGIGYPGHWDLSKNEPEWVPDPPAPTGIDDPRASRDIPVRDLLPNEAIQVGLMGVGIIRTDLRDQAAKANGQFTADDRAMLQAIYKSVVRL
jgi:hypothetical protein